jgi:ArsR family transcriptional regulator
MDQKALNRCTARARIAKAMAHPLRIRLLELLAERPACVQELADKAGAEQPTVSKHLAILRDAGLVEGKREGPAVEYRVACCCLTTFFDCIEAVLRQNVQLQKACLGR